MIMKTKAILLGTAALMFTLTSEKAIAQIGTPYIHDPSTIMECDGKYYNPLAELNKRIFKSANRFVVNVVYILKDCKCTYFP